MTQIEIKQQLHEIKSLVEQGALNNKEIWTSADFMKYTGLSYSTLTKLTSTGEISYYKPTNGKLFFLKSEILDLKSEIWNLKSEIWNLKSEIWNLKSEIK